MPKARKIARRLTSLDHEGRLFEAVKAGNLQSAAEEVECWSQQGTRAPFGWFCEDPYPYKSVPFYPLHYAASRGLTAIARMMMDAGAKINGRARQIFWEDDEQWHPSRLRHYDSEFWEWVRVSRKRFPDLPPENEDFFQALELRYIRIEKNHTPLMLACQAVDVELVQLLVQRGADIHATDQKGFSALHYAVWSRGKPCQEQLTKLKLLCERDADNNGNGNDGYWASLRDLCIARSIAMTECLLAHGADVNAKAKDGSTPLAWAINYGYPEITQLLLRHAPKELDDRTHVCDLFCLAAAYPVELVKLLKDYVDFDWCEKEHPRNPLHEACRAARFDTAEQLLRWGADPNSRDETGLSPLHHAAYYEQEDAAKMLLMYGADPNAQDETGWTPLHEACGSGLKLNVKLLLEAGSDVCIKDKAVAGACAKILRSKPWNDPDLNWPEMLMLLCQCLRAGHMEGLALYKAKDRYFLRRLFDEASFRQKLSNALDVHRMWMLNHTWSHEDCYRVEYSGEPARARDATTVVTILCLSACLEDDDALVHSATQGSIIKWHYQIYRRQMD
eukprot:TRINITY_DN12410_c0_g6_i3.p1 TRINITY_DN12410_c0_g6~~TRINITY_DN12410_c0_g6_i3.p1  ORF type:complete len:561 (+),score=58.65 TRINITY_DN12410_c0_g6_i3:146-1828(+)